MQKAVGKGMGVGLRTGCGAQVMIREDFYNLTFKRPSESLLLFMQVVILFIAAALMYPP